MPEQHVGPYQRDIINQLGCSGEDAAMVEDIMRNHVFHSTLDWLSEAEFRKGAKEAWTLLESKREMFEDRYRQAKEIFREMQTRTRSC